MYRNTILAILISTLCNAQQFGTLSYQSIFGSNQTDEAVSTFFLKGKTYIFGNSTCVTPNGNILTTYGGGDVIGTIQDSSGTFIKTKIFGGFASDKLIKVVQDNFGFWLYINSFSTTGGGRTLPQNCANVNTTNNDLYIVRLDLSLNIKAEYSSCFGIGLFAGQGVVNSSVTSFSDIVKKPNGNCLVICQNKNATSNEVVLGAVEIDSMGYILKYKIFAVSGSYNTYPSVSGFGKLKSVKVIHANDSICYVIGNMAQLTLFSNPYIIRQFASLVKINLNSGNVTRKMYISKYSETIINNAIFKNGKLYLYIEDFNLSSGPQDYQAFWSTYGWPIGTLTNRTVGYKTIAGKKDVWGVVVDSTTLATTSQFAIGSNDDTEVKKVQEYQGDLVVGLSTKGSAAIDKVAATFGGYDYWFVRMNTTTNTINSQLSLGGPNDDILTDFQIINGVTIATGKSKSGPGGTKTSGSLDASTLGDIWTLGFCVPPVLSFYADKYNFMAGELVTFTNTSLFTNNYTWDFKDGTFSYDENAKHYYYNPGIHDITLTGSSLSCNSSQTYYNYFTVGTPVVGIEEYQLPEGGIFAPNPAQSEIKINKIYEDQNYSIVDCLGRTIKEGIIEPTIVVEDLEPGIFYFIIKTNNKYITTKLIKE